MSQDAPTGGGWFDETVEAFLANEGLAASTCRIYRLRLPMLLGALEPADLNAITFDRLCQYREEVRQRPWLPTTKQQALTVARSFVRWGLKTGRLHGLTAGQVAEALPIKEAKPELRPAAMGLDEVLRLWRATESPRDRAIIGLRLFMGLRPGEISRLCCCDLEFGDGGSAELWVHGRMGKQKEWVDHQETALALLHYLEATGRDERHTSPLFLAEDRGAGSRPPTALSEVSVRSLTKKSMKRAGLDPMLTPRALRDTFVMEVISSTRDLGEIQKRARLASLSAVSRYSQRAGGMRSVKQRATRRILPANETLSTGLTADTSPQREGDLFEEDP